MSVTARNPNRNISFEKKTGLWKVKLTRDGREHFVGRFKTLEEAREARDKYETALRAPTERLKREIRDQWQVHLDTPRRQSLQARLTQMDNEALHALLSKGYAEDLVRAAINHTPN